jgi:hypothetical protein
MSRLIAIGTMALALGGLAWTGTASAFSVPLPVRLFRCPSGYALTAAGPSSHLGGLDSNGDGYVCVAADGTVVDDQTIIPTAALTHLP